MYSYFVYILECADGTFYIGQTNDIASRVNDHNGQGKKKGARYTHGRRPVKIVYKETFNSRSEALKREIELKKLTRRQKHQLIYP